MIFIFPHVLVDAWTTLKKCLHRNEILPDAECVFVYVCQLVCNFSVQRVMIWIEEEAVMLRQVFLTLHPIGQIPEGSQMVHASNVTSHSVDQSQMVKQKKYLLSQLRLS